MTEPLLSICIATFNRARFLGATLDTILTQCTDSVEVIIVDGGSSDETTSLVSDYLRRSPRLRYHRMDENGGFDRDFNEAVELAHGAWCWLFSDDDVMLPGAVATVLSKIGEGHDLILVNAEVRDAKLKDVLDPNRLKLSHDRVYGPKDQEALFTECSDYLTFIGCVVIRRSLWVARDRERYFGSLFVHYGVIFQAPLPGTTLALGDPKIAVRYGNAMWTSRGFEIWMFKWPQLVWSMPFPNLSKERIVAREPWRSPFRLMILRAVGAYSRPEYLRFIAPRLTRRRRDLLASLAAVGIAAFPGVLANALATVALAVLKPRPSTTRVDLRNSRFRLSGTRK